MKKESYQKGNLLTFPLELTEIDQTTSISQKDYLYPREVLGLQQMVEEYCDRMEYDGSMMYDDYPDKVMVERMAGRICDEEKCGKQKGIDRRWLKALVQVLLCNEMAFRRDRRRCHKERLRK